MKGIFTEAVWMPIDQVKPYPKNPKKHPPEQVEKIAKSIKAFGFDQPIVVDKDMVIIKGHGRLAASRHLGLTEVPVIVRSDMTENEARASRIADNQTADTYWLMNNLMKELEALYHLDADLELTGFSDREIKTMLPGLLETSEDFAIKGGLEGVVPAQLITGLDGKVGSSVAHAEGSLVEWINKFERILVPCAGDRHGVAALIWAVNNCDKEKIVAFDTNFGQRMWRWHDDYLTYLEGQLSIQIKRAEDRCQDWKDEIKRRGYPTHEQPWCCNTFRYNSYKRRYTENPENTVVIFGFGANPPSELSFRQMGRLDDGAYYAAPFFDKDDKEVLHFSMALGIMLNPLYSVTDQYICPGCPMYGRPDAVFLKEHDLDLWIRWMIYFGRAQFCKEYVDSGAFGKQAIELIGDGAQARETGKYAEFALYLLDCPQPKRQQIREGDDYGWDPEKDAKLPQEGRYDISRGRWWVDVGHSANFKKMMEETERAKAARGDMPLDQYMEIAVAEAKRKAEEEGLT
jgi:hypothetical protein